MSFESFKLYQQAFKDGKMIFCQPELPFFPKGDEPEDLVIFHTEVEVVEGRLICKACKTILDDAEVGSSTGLENPSDHEE